MVAMTGRARRSAQVTPQDKRLVVDTAVVLDELIRGDAVSRHVFRVGMTASAGGRYVNRVHGGPGITGSAYIVNAVAIRAYRNLGVAGRQALAVNTGVILT